MDNFEKRKPSNNFRFKLLSDDLRRMQFLDFKNINIIVYGPPNEVVMNAQKLLQDNNKTKFKSIINRISMAWFLFFFNNEIKVLLSGDTENYIWKRMFQLFNDKKYTGNLKCDLIKIAHHGGLSSYSKDLFEKIAFDKSENKKSKVIISTGGTTHHPDEKVLKSILEKNTDLYCTNKGPICRNLNDPLLKSKNKPQKDLWNIFKISKKEKEKQIKAYRRTKEKLKLKPKRNECSGDMTFKISQSKKVEVFHQERPVNCFYKKQRLNKTA